MNTLTDWILAICAVAAVFISIWGLIKTNKNKKEIINIKQTLSLEIIQIKQSLAVLNKTNQGNIVNVGNANNNGIAGVFIEGNNQ
ncbi:MAG: hypothetical protein FD181_1327 [Prolixibacteraceae bacterium]|nr:MAG: hypothetical protein FD181_1327 [Prolixibacteraceae bacterium]